MDIHDRLRSELAHRSDDIEVDGAGPEAVMATADRRLRRTRIAGGVIALVLVVGVAGTAIVLRDDDAEVATQTAASESDGAESGASTGDGEGAPAVGDVAAGESGGDPDDAGETVADEATAEAVEPDATEGSETDGADDTAGADPTPAPDGSDTPTAPGLAGPTAVEIIAHDGGFVAQRSGGGLWYSADGSSWRALDTPAPNDGGPGLLASDGSTLWAAGTASTGAGPVPWVERADGTASWSSLTVPQPPDDGSPLTRFLVNITGLGAGPAGVVVTGEVLVDLDITAIIGADAAASDNWSIGDSSGDLSKVLVYDDSTGDVVAEYDLLELGVPQETLDHLNGPDHEPYVAIGDTSLTLIDSDLADGTILSNVTISGGEMLAAGFSRDFSGRILWSSTDGATWTPVPVSVVPAGRGSAFGTVGDRVVVFSTQGPLLTVQTRRGGQWSEVRLDESFGSANDTYDLIDAGFGPDGAAAVVAVTDAGGDVTHHLLTSTNGIRWTATRLDAAVGATVRSVSSVGVSGSSALVSYEVTGGSETAAVALG